MTYTDVTQTRAIPDLSRLGQRRDWQAIATSFQATRTGQSWEASTYTLALNRLENDDVTRTRYGLRIALRKDLGDDRVAAHAYWLMDAEGDWQDCRCYSKKARGYCSHELAARIFHHAGGVR